MKILDDGPREAEGHRPDGRRSLQKDAPWSFGYFPTSAAAFQQWVYNGKPTHDRSATTIEYYLRLDPALRVAQASPSGTSRSGGRCR